MATPLGPLRNINLTLFVYPTNPSKVFKLAKNLLYGLK